MNINVAFLIFKRPDTTAKVFEAIRQAQPQKLLVIADGARKDRLGEAEKCVATQAIIEGVDWECEVLKNYSEVNLGCAKRVSSGLNWVFDLVEDAVIIEDDCIPHPSFFRFCEELLQRYRDDQRIMSIAGSNFQYGRSVTDYSYYYSLYHDCWGWATWRRAWKHFDFEMKLWPKLKETSFLQDQLLDANVAQYWHQKFDLTYELHKDSWFYRWLYSCWVQNGIALVPNINSVSNIGFSAGATHTVEDSRYANLPVAEIPFPLKHPPFMFPNREADRLNFLNRC
ncbi:MAG: glycosyltransferase family 2 protein, partial [Waterburya sp.]